jgi:hypothetical protein
MRTERDGVAALLEALEEQGGTVAALVDRDALAAVRTAPGPAQVAASGPRASGREDEYELLLEMIIEGSRLHYGPHRIVRTDDADLALLVGDQLYALGLARLATLGDLYAVSELADIISLVAQAHAAGDQRLAAAVWDAGAMAIGWGEREGHALAKQLARSGDGRAEQALREATPLL